MNPLFPQHCLNCNHPVEDQYCSHCGQKVAFKRISWSYLWHEIFHFFTHMEKGFLFTTKQMLLNPGQVCIHYIVGRRKRYQPPVSYFLVWTSIFLLTLYLFVKLFGEKTVIDYHDYFGPGMTTTFAISNLSIMLALIIPIQSLYLFLVITKDKYNYVETLTMIVFVIGTIIFLQFIFAILSLLIFMVTHKAIPLQYSDVFKFAYFSWFAYSITRAHPRSHRWIRTIALLFCITATFTLWRLFGVPAIVNYFFH